MNYTVQRLTEPGAYTFYVLEGEEEARSTAKLFAEDWGARPVTEQTWVAGGNPVWRYAALWRKRLYDYPFARAYRAKYALEKLAEERGRAEILGGIPLAYFDLAFEHYHPSTREYKGSGNYTYLVFSGLPVPVIAKALDAIFQARHWLQWIAPELNWLEWSNAFEELERLAT